MADACDEGQTMTSILREKENQSARAPSETQVDWQKNHADDGSLLIEVPPKDLHVDCCALSAILT